ncbi:MAG: CHASE domain-containing protein [Marinobacter sp.]|uniref:CHASE domain-containing protein n=1 Tax=Marinobacter sp. TaxID=50741 RepID=UPI00299E106E|nr:CHASE domain-containing protein [Marinobacter sp.]MDX1634933.1 CHASE domain-containing protein [Marinobacter sp.]
MTDVSSGPAVSGRRRLSTGLALFLLYTAAALLSLNLAFATTNVSPVWPPAGIAVAGLLLLGRAYWPAILLGAWLANLVGFAWPGMPDSAAVSAALVIAIGNTLEAVLAVTLVARLGGITSLFGRPTGVFFFLLVAMVSCAVSALVGAGALWLWQFAPASDTASVLTTWWLGNLVGVFLVVPLALCARRPKTPKVDLRSAGSALALLAAVALVSWLCFGSSEFASGEEGLLVFLYLPCLAFAAYRFGLVGVALTGPVVVGVAVLATINELGPFAYARINTALITLDVFALLWLIAGLAFATDLAERRRVGNQQKRELLTSWAILLAAVGLTVVSWRLVSLNTDEVARDRFTDLSEEIQSQIADRMLDYEQVLRGGVGLMDASDEVSARDWSRYVEDLKLEQSYPGIQGIGYAAYLDKKSAVEALAQQLREQGYDDFRVKPAGERDIYVPVAYLAPMDWRNQRAHGYDMFSEESRRMAMVVARDTGETTISARIVLVQETQVGTQAGFLMYLPVYRGGSVPATVEARRQQIEGYVYSPFRMNDLVEAILADQFPEVGVTIYDGQVPDKAGIMYQSQTLAEATNGLFTRTATLPVANRRWTLETHATRAFLQGVDRQKSQIVLVSGVIISLLLFSFVRTLMLNRSRAQALAREMTQAYRQSESKFSSLADTAAEAIFIVSDQGRILFSNPTAVRLFGYSPAELESMFWYQLVPASEREQRQQEARERLGSAQQNTAASQEIKARCQRKDGSVFPVEFSFSIWSGDSGFFIGVILRDVTETLEAQRRLDHARLEAEKANRAKSEFLANMSHEIRTPMNAVLGMTQLLAETELTAEQQKYLENAALAGRSLMTLLNDILDLSRVEAGQMQIEPVVFDLEEMVQVFHTIMSVAASEKPIQTDIRIADEVPRILRGDQLRIQQILMNLLSNALKFTERGSVILTIDLQRREEDQVTLVFRVTDTGIGISKAHQKKLFKAFSQADTSMTRRFGGSGLGLVISRHLARLMGGDIELDSEPGRGSEFRVFLPVTVVRAEELIPSTEPLALAGSLTGIRILLAEDNPLNQVVARGLLEQAGAEVTLADNGREAVDMLSAEPDAWDLVLMDVQMPVMDGREASTEIRRRLGLDLPIIAMTAGVTASERAACEAAGMDGFVAKPVVARDMVSEIQARLGRAKASTLAPVSAAGDAAPDAGRPQSATPELNLEKLMDSLRAVPERAAALQNLIAGIAERRRAAVREARDLWLQGHSDEAARALHTLRGSVGSLGAHDFAELTLAVEADLKQPAGTVADNEMTVRWERLEDAFESVMAAIDRWLAEQKRGNEDLPVEALDVARIQALMDLLAAHDLEAQVQFAELRPALARVMAEADLRSLDAAMTRLDYAAASAVLDSLLRNRP